MVRKLKEFSIFSGRVYKRHGSRYNTKADVVKKAKDLRKKGFRVIRDKGGEGHFLWTYKASWTASKSKSKPRVKTKLERLVEKDKKESLKRKVNLKIIESKKKSSSMRIPNKKSSNSPAKKKYKSLTTEEINAKIDNLDKYFTLDEIAKEGFTGKQYIVRYLYKTGRISEKVKDEHWKIQWGRIKKNKYDNTRKENT